VYLKVGQFESKVGQTALSSCSNCWFYVELEMLRFLFYHLCVRLNSEVMVVFR